MKVLMFSIDASIFERDSQARERMALYGKIVDELHIVVYTKPGMRETRIAPNVVAYPTNTRWRPIYLLESLRLAKRVMQSTPCLLVTAQEAITNMPAFLVARKYKISFEAQIHTDFLAPYFRRESFKNRLRYHLYRFGVTRASCVRAVSTKLKNSMEEVLGVSPAKISVLPIYVDAEKIRAGRARVDLHEKYPQFKKIILMASRLTKEKNIGLAMRALRHVMDVYPQTGLVIVGEGPERSNLERQAKEYNIENYVVFESWTDDLVSYYKTADLFLVTSHYEGYGRTIVEALAAGCPVVATDVGVARQAGAWVADEEGKLPSAIAAFLKEGLRGHLGSILYASEEEYLKKLKAAWSRCV